MIVLDASAMLEQLLSTSKGQQVREQFLVEGESFHVPHVLDLEVTQVLRRYSHSHLLTDHRAAQAIEDFLDFPLIRYSHEPFLSRIWELRENFTAYDAVYVALAEVLNVPLVTCDARLASAPGHSADMILF
ncbi:MAG: type II toxin-antitoxin system VapC family toxin [Nitrospirales bacterium]